MNRWMNWAALALLVGVFVVLILKFGGPANHEADLTASEVAGQDAFNRGDLAEVDRVTSNCTPELPASEALARCLNVRAEALYGQSRVDESQKALDRAYEIEKQLPLPLDVQGRTLNELAELEERRGRAA